MKTEYLHLKPNSVSLEAFDNYYARVKALLPNFPSSVLQQWFYEHFDSAITDYAWLGFERLSFNETTWPIERIITKIKARNELAVENWKLGRLQTPLITQAGLSNLCFKKELGPYLR